MAPPGRRYTGETYCDLATDFGISTTTVYRYLREALELLAAIAPSLPQAIDVARGKAYVMLDATLLRIDRVATSSGRTCFLRRQAQVPQGERVDHRRPGRTADLGLTGPARRAARHGRRPRGRHRRGHHHRRGASGGRHRLPGRRPRGTRAAASPSPGYRHRRYRPLSRSQREVITAHARQRGPGERANAELKSWKILRKIRASPSRATTGRPGLQPLILVG